MMRRFVLLSLLVCLALLVIGCKSGAAVYGRYPGSTDKNYVPEYQQRDVFYPVDLCCVLGDRLYCETPQEIQGCLRQGGRLAKPGTIPTCCEIGGEIKGNIVESFTFYDCRSRGGRVVPCR